MAAAAAAVMVVVGGGSGLDELRKDRGNEVRRDE
jgi:hypothetical protein